MFRAIGFVFKVAIFSLAVLILGNWIKWDGLTLSDQVKTHLSHAESTVPYYEKLKDWAGDLVDDARAGAVKRKSTKNREDQEIKASERQKLRALIRELNSSRAHD